MAEPISIQQLKDASLDVKSLEEVVNGDENVVVTTRLGEIYPSIKSVLENTISRLGFVTVDSFEDGATITQRNQALRHAETGKLYRWAGDLPKTVPASSTPTSSGGVGANAWLEVSDVALRQDLASPTGIGLVGGFKIVTPEMYGAKSTLGNIVDDSDAVKMAMQSGHHVFLAVKYGVSEGINTGKEGQVVFGISKSVSGLTAMADTWKNITLRNTVIQMVHDNCRFTDFTVDGNHVRISETRGLHGVMCSETVNFSVERVEAIDCTGYGFWALSAPNNQTATGYYLGCTSINNGVLFEQTSVVKVELYSCIGIAGNSTSDMFHPYDDNILVSYINCSAYPAEGVSPDGLPGVSISTITDRSFGEIIFTNCNVRTVNNGSAVVISVGEGNTGKVTFNGGTYTSLDGVSMAASGDLDLHVNGSKFEGVGGFGCPTGARARTTITGAEIKAVGTDTVDPIWALKTVNGDVTVVGGTISAQSPNSYTAAVLGTAVISDETRLFPSTATGRLKVLLEGIGHVILQQGGATSTFGHISVNWYDLDRFNIQLSVYKDDTLMPYSLNWYTLGPATIQVNAIDLPVGTKVYYRWVLVE